LNRTTEQDSLYNNLEEMDTLTLLSGINDQDKTVALAIEKKLPEIEKLVNAIFPKMQLGGRLFYLGAGTSGRLGVVDASECPPTFGVEHGVVVGLIAGGDAAIRKAVENAEDDSNAGIKDLESFKVNVALDSIIGIAASGTTPYVVGAIEHFTKLWFNTGCITCNLGSPLAKVSKYPIEVVTGPEFITGSTRMKAGSAQKMVLNMISTSLMVKLGHVKGNKMVDMRLSNSKLIERGTLMVMEQTKLSELEAKNLLLESGSVRKAIEFYNNKA